MGETPGAFGAVDLVILLAYMGGVILWGAWLGRGNKGGEDYFLGARKLPWQAVMLSVVATETSTLTFLSIPGIAYLGTLAFLQLAIGYLAGRVVVAFVLIPRYFQGGFQTAYAFLEERFGQGARRFASAVFMATRLLGDSVRLFLTAVPLAVITGWSYPVSILVIAAATLIYTYAGGIRAVIWVDALQMLLYLAGGVIALVLIGGALPGGWSGILSAAGEAGKLQIVDFSWDLGRPYTLLAGVIGGAILSMGSHGTDHLIVQRLLTCRSAREAGRALIGSGVAVGLQFALFLMVGIGLWSFFGGADFSSPDEVMARFIVEEIPVGVRAILIAGVFAAAMSTLSSSVNSLASATTYDFLAARRGHRLTDADALRKGRAYTLLWAALLSAGAMVFTRFARDASAVEVALAVASLVYGALLGAFLLGLQRKARRPSEIGLGAAMAAGIGAVVLLWSGTLGSVLGWLLSRPVDVELAWPWFAPTGLVVTFLVGMAWPVFAKKRDGLN